MTQQSPVPSEADRKLALHIHTEVWKQARMTVGEAAYLIAAHVASQVAAAVAGWQKNNEMLRLEVAAMIERITNVIQERDEARAQLAIATENKDYFSAEEPLTIVPVLVLPADPESVEALRAQFVKVISNADANDTCSYDEMARAALTALGFTISIPTPS